MLLTGIHLCVVAASLVIQAPLLSHSRWVDRKILLVPLRLPCLSILCKCFVYLSPPHSRPLPPPFFLFILFLPEAPIRQQLLHHHSFATSPLPYPPCFPPPPPPPQVKTTQPKRDLVKPNQGVLPPNSTEKIQIQVVPKERQQ